MAEKTGYPIDMLELDMQLDVDLGIDSIKRVEILSAVQERLPIARAIGPEQVGSLTTLRQIADFLAHSPTPTAPQQVASANGSGSERNAAAAETSQNPQTGAFSVDGSPGTADRAHSNGVAAARPVALARLYPRAHSFELPDRREEVSLPAGGTVWITDDGSPLAQALERKLMERGYACRVVRLDEAGPPEASERLCGLIVLALRDAMDHAVIAKAFRMMRGTARHSKNRPRGEARRS